jgi:hypothetical protein
MKPGLIGVQLSVARMSIGGWHIHAKKLTEQTKVLLGIRARNRH